MSERMVIFTDKGKKYDVTEYVDRIVAEARADEARRCAADVCCYCAGMEIAGIKVSTAIRLAGNHWKHTTKGDDISVACAAGPIHERLHRESQKGGNHAKTETQIGAD